MTYNTSYHQTITFLAPTYLNWIKESIALILRYSGGTLTLPQTELLPQNVEITAETESFIVAVN